MFTHFQDYVMWKWWDFSTLLPKYKFSDKNFLKNWHFWISSSSFQSPTITDWTMMKNLLLIFSPSYYSETFLKEKVIFVEPFQAEFSQWHNLERGVLQTELTLPSAPARHFSFAGRHQTVTKTTPTEHVNMSVLHQHILTPDWGSILSFTNFYHISVWHYNS